MQTICAVVLLTILGLGTAPVMAALDRVGDFALLDSSGEFHQLSCYQHRKVPVLNPVRLSVYNRGPVAGQLEAIVAGVLNSPVLRQE